MIVFCGVERERKRMRTVLAAGLYLFVKKAQTGILRIGEGFLRFFRSRFLTERSSKIYSPYIWGYPPSRWSEKIGGQIFFYWNKPINEVFTVSNSPSVKVEILSRHLFVLKSRTCGKMKLHGFHPTFERTNQSPVFSREVAGIHMNAKADIFLKTRTGRRNLFPFPYISLQILSQTWHHQTSPSLK